MLDFPNATVHIHIHQDISNDITEILNLTNTKLNKIMATLQELNAKIAELQQTVDTEQQEVSDALAALTAEVASLKEIIAAGATPEQLQASADAITAIIEDVKTTIPNLPEPTPPDA